MKILSPDKTDITRYWLVAHPDVIGFFESSALKIYLVEQVESKDNPLKLIKEFEYRDDQSIIETALKPEILSQLTIDEFLPYTVIGKLQSATSELTKTPISVVRPQTKLEINDLAQIKKNYHHLEMAVIYAFSRVSKGVSIRELELEIYDYFLGQSLDPKTSQIEIEFYSLPTQFKIDRLGDDPSVISLNLNIRNLSPLISYRRYVKWGQWEEAEEIGQVFLRTYENLKANFSEVLKEITTPISKGDVPRNWDKYFGALVNRYPDHQLSLSGHHSDDLTSSIDLFSLQITPLETSQNKLPLFLSTELIKKQNLVDLNRYGYDLLEARW